MKCNDIPFITCTFSWPKYLSVHQQRAALQFTIHMHRSLVSQWLVYLRGSYPWLT